MPEADPRTPRPAEERSYVAFAFTALSLSLGVGLTLGIVIAVADSGGSPLAARIPRLIQAHAWTQLQGWLGLFVAGMGLRLMPRLAGRRPLPRALAVAVLVLLGLGVVLRVVAQALLDGSGATLVLRLSAGLSAGGSVALGVGLAIALLSRGRRWQAWRLAAWAGTAWWFVWGAITLIGASTAGDGLVSKRVDEAAVWAALLGVMSNFVWAVQSRSVPVFYGRPSPTAVQLAPPLAVLNLGVVLILTSASGLGLALAGIATVWLAPTAGSIAGTAHRLRPASRGAARFIVSANLWAMVAGALLLATAATSSEPLRDAALHAAGLGFMTTLILGMAQTLMPSFAGERIGRGGPRPELWLSWPALMLAAALRVAGAGLGGQAQAIVITSSGVLAWVALAAFALGMARASRGSRGTRLPSPPAG